MGASPWGFRPWSLRAYPPNTEGPEGSRRAMAQAHIIALQRCPKVIPAATPRWGGRGPWLVRFSVGFPGPTVPYAPNAPITVPRNRADSGGVVSPPVPFAMHKVV